MTHAEKKALSAFLDRLSRVTHAHSIETFEMLGYLAEAVRTNTLATLGRYEPRPEFIAELSKFEKGLEEFRARERAARNGVQS